MTVFGVMYAAQGWTISMNENTCICCGAVIPEGRQICWICEHNDKIQSLPSPDGGEKVRKCMGDIYAKADEYCKMRDSAVIRTVLTGDTEPIKHVFRWNHLPIPSEQVLMITACKCACNTAFMPKNVVKKAKKWLYEHDYSPEIGED